LPQKTGADWARLFFDSTLLVRNAMGDCEGILGASPRTLLESREPIRFLPSEFALLLSGAASSSGPSLAFSGDLIAISEQVQGGGQSLLVFRRTGEGEPPGPIDDLAAGVVGINKAGVVKLWNRTMVDLFHVSRDTALGSSLEDVLPQPVLFSWSSVMAAANEGRQVKVEIRPGQDRRVEALFSFGGPGILGTFSDTSDSFQTEKRLRTARRMNQTYLQTVRTGLVLFGPDYRLLVANKAFGDIFGLREVLTGMPIYEILPPESFADLEKNSRLLFEGDQTISSTTISCRSRDARDRVIVQTFKPVRSEDEESFLVVGLFDDCSGLASAEADLRASRESQRLLSSLLTTVVSAGLPAGSSAIAAGLCEAIGATASAVYLSQPYGTTRLTGTAGLWNASLPFDFSDLHFPPSVWNVLPGSSLSGSDLGALRGVVEHCVVLPVGSGSGNRGFLIASFHDEADSSRSVQPMAIVAEALHLRADFVSLSSQLEQTTYFLERHRRLLREFIGSADVPAAVFGEDWRVVHWNRAMEVVTGCTAETARKRNTMAMDMLFGPVGGVASARKLVKRFGSGESPAVWEIRKADGSPVSMAWRLFRADAAEADSMEAMTVLLGSPIAAGASASIEAEATAERFDVLNRGLVRLISSDTPARLAESIASLATVVSGARKATVEFDGPEGSHSASSVSEAADDQEAEAWSVPLQVGSRTLGTLTLEGGSSNPLVSDFARAAARVLQWHEEALLGNRVESMLRTRGGYLVCDRTGRILLSSMSARAGSAVLSPGSDLIEEAGPDGPGFRLALDTALRLGRSAFHPSGGGRFAEPLLLSAIGSPDADSAVVIRLLSAGPSPELVPLDPGSWCAAFEILLEALPKAASAAGERLTGISRALGRDDPVRPSINALSYDFTSLSRTAAFLHLIFRSTFPSVLEFRPAALLDDLVERWVKSGRRPPDISLESELPVLSADPVVLREALTLLADIGGWGEMPQFAVSEASRTGSAAGGAQVRPRGAVFTLRWKRRIAAPVPLPEALEALGRGDLSASAEIALVDLALRLAGCFTDLSSDGTGLSITVSPASG
jgi:PAS domain-containing protein